MLNVVSAPINSSDANLQNLNVEDLINIFNGLFSSTENTRLVRGDDEPIYLPANENYPFSQIIFAHGFYASALHEIAHWCIAGEQRRQLIDYGYWYAPDGRSKEQQQVFEQVEVKPQALEWVLSKACNKPFRVSVDNLNGEVTDSMPFKKAVYHQVLRYCEQGLPERARLLFLDLSDFYATPWELSVHNFSLQELG